MGASTSRNRNSRHASESADASFHPGDDKSGKHLSVNAAAALGDVYTVERRLINDPALITRTTLYSSQTLAHISASKGQLAVLQLLVDFITKGLAYIGAAASGDSRLHGISTRTELITSVLNSRNRKGRTPLIEASAKGHFACVEYLLSKGADPWDVDNVSCRNSLHYACMGGHLQIVAALLNSVPYNASRGDRRYVDSRSWSGHVPLSCAIAKGHLDVMKLLLTHNPDINYASFYASFMDDSVKCPAFSTPMHIAARSGSMEAAFELLLHFAQRPLTSELEDPRTLPDCNQRLPHEIAQGCGFLDLHTFLLPGRQISDLFTQLELTPIVMCSLAHLASAALRRRLLDDLTVAEAQETAAAAAASTAAATAVAVAAAAAAAAADAKAAAAAAAARAAAAATAMRAAADKASAQPAFTAAILIPGPSAWRDPHSPRNAPPTHNTYDSPQPWTMTRLSASYPHISQSLPSDGTHTDTLEHQLPASHQPPSKLAFSPPPPPLLARLRHSTSHIDTNLGPTFPPPSTLARLRHSNSHADSALSQGARLSPTRSSGTVPLEERSSLPHLTTRPLGLHTRNYSLPGMPSYDDFGSSSDGDDVTHADNNASSSTATHPTARLPGAFVSYIPRGTRATSDGVIPTSPNNSLVRFLDFGSRVTPPLVLPPVPQLGWTEALQEDQQYSCRTTRSSAIRSTSDIREVQEACRAAEAQQWSKVQQMCDDLPGRLTLPHLTNSGNTQTTADRLVLPRTMITQSSGDAQEQSQPQAQATDSEDVYEFLPTSGTGVETVPSGTLGTADQRERRDVVLAMSKTFNTIVVEATDEGNLCDVCYDNPEQVTMDRCGHRLCRSCSTKITALMQETPLLCPFCRTVVHTFSFIPVL